MVSENLRNLRQKKGLTQTELSKLAGIHYKTVGIIEAGGNPNLDTLEKLAKALNVTVNDLIE